MASITRWDPWQQISRLQEQLEEVLGGAARRGRGEAAEGGLWLPPVDVERTADKLLFKLDLPGMKAADLNIEVQDRTLVISGERREDREQDQQGYYSRERIFGQFSRSFTLPAGVEEDQIEADFKDGVLCVRVPLPKESQPRKIQVRSGSSG